MYPSLRWIALFVGVVGTVPPSTTRAAASDFELTVRGKHDALNVPVVVSFRLPIGVDRLSLAEIAIAGGKPITGQLTAVEIGPRSAALPVKLQFVLPAIKAGETLHLHGTFKTASAGGDSADSFNWKDAPGEHCLLSFGSRPVLDFMCRPLDESSKEA